MPLEPESCVSWLHACVHVTRCASCAQALTNILLVPAEGLMALVNGALRLDHREALQYLRLREDYATATVDGRPLHVRDRLRPGNLTQKGGA
jgi:hypothetical protein